MPTVRVMGASWIEFSLEVVLAIMLESVCWPGAMAWKIQSLVCEYWLFLRVVWLFSFAMSWRFVFFGMVRVKSW